MRISAPLLLCLFLIIGITGCVTDTDKEDSYQDVRGVVLSNGNPVTDADIHIKNNFIPGGFIEGDEPGKTSKLEFEVDLAGDYVIKLFRFGTTEPISTVFEGNLDKGNHSFSVSNSLLSNGVFVYQITTPLNQVAQNIFLVNKTDESIINTLPFTTTDSNGAFVIPAVQLALGETFLRNNNEFEISDSLQIIVVKDEEILGKGQTQVQTSDEAFVEISVD